MPRSALERNANIKQTSKPRKLYAELLGKPSFLRDMIEEIDTIEDRFPAEKHKHKQSNTANIVEPVERLCTCRRLTVQQSSKKIFPALELFSQTTASHRRDCPWSQNQLLIRKMGLNIFHISKLLGIVIQCSFAVQFGAGGLSISPYLALRGFSRNNSPAFTLFEEFGWYEASTVPQYVSILGQISTRLQLLFTNGESSPYETDESGGTLLHVSLMH